MTWEINMHLEQPCEPQHPSVQILNQILACEMVLYVKLYNYHWNVIGPAFQDLHGMFSDQYETLIDHVDVVAERIRALKGTPYSTMREFLEQSSLTEGDCNKPAEGMIGDVGMDHVRMSTMTQLAFENCTANGDDGSADMLLPIQDFHDKSAWMLRSYLGER